MPIKLHISKYRFKYSIYHNKGSKYHHYWFILNNYNILAQNVNTGSCWTTIIYWFISLTVLRARALEFLPQSMSEVSRNYSTRRSEVGQRPGMVGRAKNVSIRTRRQSFGRRVSDTSQTTSRQISRRDIDFPKTYRLKSRTTSAWCGEAIIEVPQHLNMWFRAPWWPRGPSVCTCTVGSGLTAIWVFVSRSRQPLLHVSPLLSLPLSCLSFTIFNYQ